MADLAIGEALRDEIENTALLIGEIFERIFVGWLSYTVKHLLGNGWVEKRFTVGNASHRCGQFDATHLLQQVSRRAGHDGAHQRIVVTEGREHQATQVGHQRAGISAHGDAVTIGQAHIENGNVGLAGGNTADGLLRRTGLAHHFHVGFALEEFP